MSCEYCEMKPPTKRQRSFYGDNEVGRYIVDNDQLIASIVHETACRALPSWDKWSLCINQFNSMSGTYFYINYCPMCGRKLGSDAE